ncbi:MAG: hypothetical protein GX234_03055 [Clostridiales bacterium]|mgnify:CR=1 FL=1|nr:hypothetical protein [Clostridiales bacterium]
MNEIIFEIVKCVVVIAITGFEKPTDQSVSVQKKRTEYPPRTKIIIAPY